MQIIKVENVYKSFKVFYDKGATLKEKLLFQNRNHYEEHQVLKGIDLSIKKGEVIGLIGQNGCGKSTLLKLMTRIIYPDKGKIEVNGKVSSLLELGAGFHPDMTGRENIYTNASIFGLTKKQIDKKIDSIIAFSELRHFIDNPVRTYSSGMYMRLAFAVAINVEAEILFIDEILAVGDTNFQLKCFNKLRELKNKGITIVIVSHDLGSIEKLCDKVIWLNEGIIKNIGPALPIIDKYLQFMNGERRLKLEEEYKSHHTNEETANEETANEETANEETANEETANEETANEETANEETANEETKPDINRWGSKEVEIVDAYFINKNNYKTNVLDSKEKVSIVIEYKINKEIEEYVFGMGIYTLDGHLCYGNNTQLDRLEIKNISKKGKIYFHIENIGLLAGEYFLNVAVVDKNGRALDFIKYYSEFTILSKDKSVGIYSINHKWSLEK